MWDYRWLRRNLAHDFCGCNANFAFQELEDCKNSTDTCKKKNDGLDEDLIKCEGEKKRCEDDHDDCKDDHKECEKEKQKIKDDAEEKIEVRRRARGSVATVLVPAALE